MRPYALDYIANYIKVFYNFIMFKDVILFVKYPYTAGVIATMWLGTAILLAISRDLDPINVVLINMAASCVVAILGFRGGQEA
jgi:hypothetical protein